MLWEHLAHHKPHLGALLCSWAKNSFGGGVGLEVLDLQSPGELGGAATPAGSALQGWLSSHHHPTPSPSSGTPPCLSFPPWICPISGRCGVLEAGSTSPADEERQELARAQLGAELQPQGAALELLLWITVREKGKREGGRKKKPKHFVFTNALFEQDYFLTPR